MCIDGHYAPRQINQANGITLVGANFEAWFGSNLSDSSANLGVVSEDEFAQINVLDNFLRVFSAHLVLGQGGVMLHSAGLVFDGLAYIFVGRSNVGKTTLSRKAHQVGARVLSDDINLLLPREGGYHAFAVPFTGEFGRTIARHGERDSYPVAAIVLLAQGESLQTKTVSSSIALARLLVGCPFVNTDADASNKLLDRLTEVVDSVPVIELSSRRDDDIKAIMNSVKRSIYDV